MAGPLYSAPPRDQFHVVELDGLTALFHSPSGVTHILAPPAPEILYLLADEPAGLPAILARLKENFDLEGGRGAYKALQARLDELERVGLVCRL